MKKWIFILLFFPLCTAYALEGNDDNVTRDFYVELYKKENYVKDFNLVFKTESDKRDYKKLREYLNQKKEIERILQMAGDEYYYGLSFNKQYADDYIQSLEDELKIRDPEDKMLLRLNSMMPNVNYHGEYTVEYVLSDILPVLKDRYRQAEERDSCNQVIYMQIQKNIEAVRQDVFLCEEAIYASLAPEYREQDFRIWISLTFSGLIATLLCLFFWIIYRRSDVSLSKMLLGETGLQFITVFILIIAIILFGILNVLGGSELAAILSGISGYILGKGGNQAASDAVKPTENNTKIPREQHLEPILSSLEPEKEMEKREEQEPEETYEKYFPGGNA